MHGNVAHYLPSVDHYAQHFANVRKQYHNDGDVE